MVWVLRDQTCNIFTKNVIKNISLYTEYKVVVHDEGYKLKFCCYRHYSTASFPQFGRIGFFLCSNSKFSFQILVNSMFWNWHSKIGSSSFWKIDILRFVTHFKKYFCFSCFSLAKLSLVVCKQLFPFCNIEVFLNCVIFPYVADKCLQIC